MNSKGQRCSLNEPFPDWCKYDSMKSSRPINQNTPEPLDFILLNTPPFLPFSRKVLQFKPTRFDTFLLLRRLNSPSILHNRNVLQQRCWGANVTVNPPSHNLQFKELNFCHRSKHPPVSRGLIHPLQYRGDMPQRLLSSNFTTLWS